MKYTFHIQLILPLFIPFGIASQDFNPFFEEIGIAHFGIRSGEDSIRIVDPGKFKRDYIDFFLKDGLLWNVKRYDKRGNPVETGDFKNGNGRLTLKKRGLESIELDFEGGMLNDSVIHYHRNLFSKKRPLIVSVYKKGYLEGESVVYSLAARHITQRRWYSNGVIQKIEQFGTRKQIPIPFIWLIRTKYTNIDTPCARWTFVNGKEQSKECFVQNCRNCGY